MSPSAKQALFVPLGVGLETDVDDKLLPLGKVLEIENASVFETGDLVKRFGSNQMSGLIQPGGGALPQAWQLATHKGALVSLSVPGPTPIATYSPTKGAWSVPDPATNDRRGPISVALSKNLTAASNSDIAIGSGAFANYAYIVYGETPTTGIISTLHLAVYDLASKHFVANVAISLSPNTWKCSRIAFVNGFAVAAYEDTAGNVSFTALNASTLATTTTTLGAVGIVGTGGTGNDFFDIRVKDATTLSLAFLLAGATVGACDYVPSTNVATAWTLHDAAAANVPCDLTLSWLSDFGASGRIALATVSTSQGLRVQWDIPSAGATRTAATTYNADPTATIRIVNVCGHTTAATATGAFQVVYQNQDPSGVTQNNQLLMATRSAAGALTTGFVLVKSVAVQSKTWTSGGDFFLMVQRISSTSGTRYVLRIPAVTATPALATPLATLAVGAGYGAGGGHVAVVSSSQIIVALDYKIRLDTGGTVGGFNPNTAGVELATVSHLAAQDTSMGRACEAADSLLVPGGTIGQFDGQSFAEMGFAYSPEASSRAVAAGGSLTANQTYWYVYLYSYPDAQGRLWRSGISVPVSQATAAGLQTINHTIEALRLTGRTNVSVEIYRGLAGVSTLFQKVGQVANVITSDSVTFSDTVPDTTLASGEFLYTTGGGLSNDTIPGSLFVFMAKRRVWFISADNPSELWFSNVIQPGKGLVFSEVNIQRIEDENGPLYGAAALDDKVVAIKNSSVYAFNGDGPDNDGVGSFPPAELVVHGIGTTNPQSVTTGPNGVIFDSTSARPGIQMIDRSLSVAKNPDGMYWGAAVQRYNGETIVSTIVVPEQSQIRIHTISGRTLVLDLISHIWSTFTGQPSVCAVALNGAAIWATGSTTIRQEDPTGATYTDSGVGYSMRVTSPWLQVGAVRGFERVTMFQGVGRTAGDHSLALSVYRDLDDNTLVTSKTFVMTVAGRPLWDWEWVPRVQRFGAMKMVVVETSTTAGPKINGFTALLGIKPGLTRRGDGARL